MRTGRTTKSTERKKSLQEGRKGKVCSVETQRDRETWRGVRGKAPQGGGVTGLK